MDKILRIDMGAAGGPKVAEHPIGRYAALGGRALTSTVLYEEVLPTCDPLGPLNKLIIAPGLMSGSSATTSGRLSIGCKSPLTGGIKEANSGGQASLMLARLGIAAVIFEGAPSSKNLYKVVISQTGVSVSECNDLRLKGNYDVAGKIKSEYGDKVALLCIGPAGERLLANSTVAITDMEFRPTRHAARGGVGAVMGSKGVKAIVVDPAGTSIRQAKNPEGFKEANANLMKTMRKASYTGKTLPDHGTATNVNFMNEAGCLPTRNFSAGQFEEVESISGETLAALENKRGGEGTATQGCHTGCMIRCSGTFRDKKGAYVSKQPEYETVGSHGSNCGIADLDAIARLDRLNDDIGLDTIETGCTVAVLMEAGVLEFGDSEGAIRVVEEIGTGSEKGILYGSGTATVAKRYNVERAPVVKGQAMAAYDPRGLKGLGVTYATSPMGADHTAGHTLSNHFFDAEPVIGPLESEGQFMASAIQQISTAAFDATGYCLMVGFASLDRPETVKYLLDSMTTFTGINFTETNFAALGVRILRMERDFNHRAGFTAKDDRLPEWMTKEPLPPHNSVFDVAPEELDMTHEHTKILLASMKGVVVTTSPPISLFGEGSHKMVPDNLSALGVKKPLIVTDPGIVKVGLLKILTDALDEKFMEYAIYDSTQPNPTDTNVNDAYSIYQEQCCDSLISIGGGSSHDCCKGVGVIATNPGTIGDYEGVFGMFNLMPPMVAVSTTSGTGSEVTFGAVITDSRSHRKMMLADPKMTALIAVNDPLLTKTMPPHITAGTGMDALAHAIEGYISTGANPFSDGLNLHAIKLVNEYLPRAVSNGNDLDARLNMCYAQYGSGLSINSALGGNVHSVAHSLGAVYDLPHGDCNAIAMPAVLRKNAAVAAEKLGEVARVMGVDTEGLSVEEAAQKAAEAVAELNEKIGIAPNVSELCTRYGKTAASDDIERVLDLCQQDIANVTNPVRFTREDYRNVLEEIWG